MNASRNKLRAPTVASIENAYTLFYRYCAAAWTQLGRIYRAALNLPDHVAMLRLRSKLALSSPRAACRPELAARPRQIVMIAVSEVWHDPRIEREARALAAAGYEVRLLYPMFFSTSESIPPLHWGPGITFDPLEGSYARFVHAPPYIFDRRFAAAAARYRPFAFHAHDLPTALIALQAAAETGAACICDFHEWYSENVSWSVRLGRYMPHPATTKAYMRYGERLVLRHATAIVTVCDSIAAEMSDGRFGTKREIDVIRNIPPLRSIEASGTVPPLRVQLGIDSDVFIVLWQGGVGPTRLIEPIIEAFAEVEGAVLAIRGPAIRQFGLGYETLARKLGIADRVFCLDEVPSRLVVEAASSADAGVWSLPNLCKNFYYALPNKVFEYLAAGIPILGADFPEVRRLIDRYQVGVTFDPYDSHSIANAIRRLVNDRTTTKRFSENTRMALEAMRADEEWAKLARLYDRLHAQCTRVETKAA